MSQRYYKLLSCQFKLEIPYRGGKAADPVRQALSGTNNPSIVDIFAGIGAMA